MRRATRARGHFPTEQAAMNCLYLVVRSLDPTGKGAHRWMNRWKPALTAFAVTFEGRLFPTDHSQPQAPFTPLAGQSRCRWLCLESSNFAGGLLDSVETHVGQQQYLLVDEVGDVVARPFTVVGDGKGAHHCALVQRARRSGSEAAQKQPLHVV